MTTGVVSLPSPAKPIDDIAREGASILAQIPDQEKESFDRPPMRELLPRLWAVLGEWTTAYLDAHPNASAQEIVDALTAAEPVNVTAVQLATGDRAAYAVAPSYLGVGTVFVTGRVDAGQFRILWSIADADAARRAPTYELSYWRSDGPLPITGTVHALPTKRTGEARFYVDAVTQVAAGCEWPFQVSIWEWNGRTATAALVESYGRTFDTPPIELRDDVLTVHTKQLTKVFSTTGCDVRPEGVWRITISPSGIEDHRPVFVDPWFDLLDTLFDGVVRRQDVSAIASPRVTRLLTAAVAPVRERFCDMNLRLKRGRTRDVVDAASDRCGDYTFVIEHRAGKLFVAKVARASFWGVLH